MKDGLMELRFWKLIDDVASCYVGRPIVILGKGPSADDVEPSAFEHAFVIGINDASLIARVDVAVLREEWAWQQLQRADELPSVLLSAVAIADAPSNYFLGSFEPLSQENADLMLQRLFTKSLAVEEIMFLTALRIALRVKDLSQGVPIYFVGFDFSTEHGFSRYVHSSASGVSASYAQQRIEAQERVYISVAKLLAERGVDLRHVGYQTFSDLTPGALSERLKSESSLWRKPIEGQLLVTAEITTNHLGSVDRAKHMMQAAAKQGADLVKFQIRDVDSFYRPEVLASSYPSPFGSTYGEYRRGLEFSDDEFLEIARFAEDIGVRWFASVLDERSFQRALSFEMPLIKLPGTISRKRDFLTLVAESYSGDVVLSTGMTSQEYVDWVLGVFGKERNIYLLHTNSAYPTPLEDCNISIVAKYSHLAMANSNVIPGYSSHDDGSFGSVLAVGAGAKMLEKHVKLGSSEWIHFDGVALDLEAGEFADYVTDVRRAWIAVGSPLKTITPSEHHKY